MSLPTAMQLKELANEVAAERASRGRVTYNEAFEYLGRFERMTTVTTKYGISGGALVVPPIIKAGVNEATVVGSSAAVASVELAPFGAIVGPWIAVADVARQAGDVFGLHDLRAYASGSRPGYYCNCRSCAKNIDYLIEKKEIKVAKVAVGVATLGVSSAFTFGNSVRKWAGQKWSGEKGRKLEVCEALVASAQSGCTVAMAAIFLLAGDWQFLRGGNAGTMRRAIAIIISEDGAGELKSNFSS